jgi:hypothetical protein
MKVTIKIDCGNAAFEGDPGLEIARILEDLAHKIGLGGVAPGGKLPLRDINGNTVGALRVTR